MSDGSGLNPGWYPDPDDSNARRYWDGSEWSAPLTAPTAGGTPADNSGETGNDAGPTPGGLQPPTASSLLPPAPHVPQSSTRPAGAWLAIIGGGLAAIAAFLPWGTARTALISINRNAFQLGDQNGFSIDGVILLVLGIVTVLIGISVLGAFSMPRFLQRSAILSGLAITAIALLDISSLKDWADTVNATPYASASIGFGLYAAAIGGVAAAIGGVVLRSDRKSANNVAV